MSAPLETELTPEPAAETPPAPIHYSIHGNDRDGWTLIEYEIQPAGHVTTTQRRPHEFPKLKDLLEKIVGNGDIDV